MAAHRTSKLVLRNSRIILTSTLFDNDGDSVVTTANVPDQMVLSKYVRRHVVFKGRFKASFPNTNELDEFGDEGYVFPTRETYQLDNYKYQIVAEQAGSTYYCVLPGFAKERLTEEKITLSAGQTFEVPMCRVAFVFGNNFLVGTELNQENRVLCCENSVANISAINDCTILVYGVMAAT